MCKSLVNHRSLRSENLVAFKSRWWTVLRTTTGFVLVVIRDVCLCFCLEITIFCMLPKSGKSSSTSLLSLPRYPTSALSPCWLSAYGVDLSMFVVWLVCRLDPNTALPSAADLKLQAQLGVYVCMCVTNVFSCMLYQVASIAVLFQGTKTSCCSSHCHCSTS
jgi:hypothetical protein